jgi:hypothetical protein
MSAPSHCPPAFKSAAQAAFPAALNHGAGGAADALVPFVDMDYGVSSFDVLVKGEQVSIPTRIHFRSTLPLHDSLPEQTERIADCLLSRGTDGLLRHSALRRIVGLNEVWSMPYVLTLLGEYVVEIVEQIQQSLPEINLALAREFLSENPRFHSLLKARSVSYWDCYYRSRFPDYATYPAAVVFQAVETPG